LVETNSTSRCLTVVEETNRNLVLRSIDERSIVLDVFNLDDDAASVRCANAVELKLDVNEIRVSSTRCATREEERNVFECHIKNVRSSIEFPPDLTTKLW
jgi:hypothetical protein